MKTKNVMKSMGLGLAALTAGGPVVQADEPVQPNIIIIYSDDMGYNDLSCYGSQLQTPNSDRLADEGMRFTDMHSAAAVCTPSRYSLLTGRYAWRTWLKDWVLNERMPLLIEEGQLTLQEMLQDQGYVTGCVGKWHLGWGRENNSYQNGTLTPGPIETGFDYFFGLPFSHNTDTAPMNVYVRNSGVVGLEEGEDIMDPAVYNPLQRVLEDTATTLSGEAVSFIENNKDQPFFLYYPTANVHAPLTPHSRFVGTSGKGLYGDFVLEFDWAVGEVLDTLERLHLESNTLVIVASDNGSLNSGSNDPWRGKKASAYEGGHRIPFVVRWPGQIPGGSTSSVTFCQTDMMATLAELTGATLPAGAAEDSVSFLSTLTSGGATNPIREAVVHHSVQGMFAVRSNHWKLIDGVGGGRDDGFHTYLYDGSALPEIDPVTGEVAPFTFLPKFSNPAPGEPPGQLYDMSSDPSESTNLWDSQPDIVNQLKQLLWQYRGTGTNVLREVIPGALLAYDTFEDESSMSVNTAPDTTGDYDPVAGSGWSYATLQEGSDAGIQVSNYGFFGASEGDRYLRLYREGITGIAVEMQLDSPRTNVGETIHFEAMVDFSTTTPSSNMGGIQFLDTAGNLVFIIAFRENGNVYTRDSGGTWRDTGNLDYTDNSWQKLEVDWVLGQSTFTLKLDGVEAATVHMNVGDNTEFSGIKLLGNEEGEEFRADAILLFAPASSGFYGFVWRNGLSGLRAEDRDGDGQKDYVEYVMGGNPTNAADTGWRPELNVNAGTYTFYLIGDTSVVAHVVSTEDLVHGSWVTNSTIYVTAGDEAISNYTAAIDMETDQKFVRMQFD